MTDTIAGLIKRLNRVLSDEWQEQDHWLEKLFKEARDALSRLTAELAEADKLAVYHSDRADKAEAALTAPVEGLTLETSEDDRAALHEIYDGYTLRIADEGLIMALLRDHDAQAAHIARAEAALKRAREVLIANRLATDYIDAALQAARAAGIKE